MSHIFEKIIVLDTFYLFSSNSSYISLYFILYTLKIAPDSTKSLFYCVGAEICSALAKSITKDHSSLPKLRLALYLHRLPSMVY